MLLYIVYQHGSVGYIAKNQNAAFNSGDGALAEKDADQPKQDAGTYQYP